MPSKRIKEQLDWAKKTETQRRANTANRQQEAANKVNAIAPGYVNKDTVDPEGLQIKGKKKRR